MFAVLHFFYDNTIECVPASWLDGIMRIMKLPESTTRELWTVSNVETQSEGESKKRKQLVPSRFLSDTEIDSEGECVPSPPKKHQLRQC